MISSCLKLINFFKSHKFFLSITYAFSFSFSLTPFFSSLLLSCFVLLGVFHIQKTNAFFWNYKKVILYFSLFLMYLFYMFIPPFFERGITLVYRILPILILPNIIYFSSLQEKMNYKVFKRCYVLGIITSISISLIGGTYNSIAHDNIQHLFYYKLCSVLHLHPTYYSLYIITALHFIRLDESKLVKEYKNGIIVLFLIFIFLLQTKIAVIYLIIYYIIISPKLNKKDIISRKHFVFLIAFVVILSLRLDYNRFYDFFKSRATVEIGNQLEDGVSQRLWLWKEAISQIKERPWFGQGLGSQDTIFKWNVEKKLLSSQDSYSYVIASKNISKLNLHNQYLQIFYELGIVGGVFFLLSITFILAKAMKTNQQDFLYIYILFLFFMLTENLLERQMGVYFYAFILSCLYFEKGLLSACNKK